MAKDGAAVEGSRVCGIEGNRAIVVGQRVVEPAQIQLGAGAIDDPASFIRRAIDRLPEGRDGAVEVPQFQLGVSPAGVNGRSIGSQSNGAVEVGQGIDGVVLRQVGKPAIEESDRIIGPQRQSLSVGGQGLVGVIGRALGIAEKDQVGCLVRMSARQDEEVGHGSRGIARLAAQQSPLCPDRLVLGATDEGRVVAGQRFGRPAKANQHVGPAREIVRVAGPHRHRGVVVEESLCQKALAGQHVAPPVADVGIRGVETDRLLERRPALGEWARRREGEAEFRPGFGHPRSGRYGAPREVEGGGRVSSLEVQDRGDDEPPGILRRQGDGAVSGPARAVDVAASQEIDGRDDTLRDRSGRRGQLIVVGRQRLRRNRVGRRQRAIDERIEAGVEPARVVERRARLGPSAEAPQHHGAIVALDGIALSAIGGLVVGQGSGIPTARVTEIGLTEQRIDVVGRDGQRGVEIRGGRIGLAKHHEEVSPLRPELGVARRRRDRAPEVGLRLVEMAGHPLQGRGLVPTRRVARVVSRRLDEGRDRVFIAAEMVQDSPAEQQRGAVLGAQADGTVEVGQSSSVVLGSGAQNRTQSQGVDAARVQPQRLIEVGQGILHVAGVAVRLGPCDEFADAVRHRRDGLGPGRQASQAQPSDGETHCESDHHDGTRTRKGRPLPGPPSMLRRTCIRPQVILSSIVLAWSYWTAIAMGSWMARNSRGSGKNMVSVTVATVSTSIV